MPHHEVAHVRKRSTDEVDNVVIDRPGKKLDPSVHRAAFGTQLLRQRLRQEPAISDVPEVLASPVDAVTDPSAQVVAVPLDRAEHGLAEADSNGERPENYVLAIAEEDAGLVERIAEAEEIACVERGHVIPEHGLDRVVFGLPDRRRAHPTVRSGDRETGDQNERVTQGDSEPLRDVRGRPMFP